MSAHSVPLTADGRLSAVRLPHDQNGDDDALDTRRSGGGAIGSTPIRLGGAL